ncbi:MAG: hypothetical protein Ct9H300mP28_33170 [Pseudomonadota bacterium]|nr:MAG: hypothetical protein Ct9H300mP28_33170 [Pseudomonadota bacterium]
MSMQSGAPTFGTPEPQLVIYIVAALARRLGVPFRSGGGLNSAKIAERRQLMRPQTLCSMLCLQGLISCCTPLVG